MSREMLGSLTSSYIHEDEDDNSLGEFANANDDQNDYSIRAIASYSVSSASSLLNEKDKYSDDEYLEEINERKNEFHKNDRNSQKQTMEKLPFPQVPKHKTESKTTQIRNYNNDNDILQQWRRRRRLEKLKLEQKGKELNLEKQERINDIFATTTTTISNGLPVRSKPFLHSHSLKSPPDQHQTRAIYLSTQQQPHKQQQNSNTQEYQMSHELLKHPLKIHLCNISKCCKCCQSKLSARKDGQKRQPTGIRDCNHLGKRDSPAVLDLPTRDNEILRDANFQQVHAQPQNIQVKQVDKDEYKLSEESFRLTEKKLKAPSVGRMLDNKFRKSRENIKNNCLGQTGYCKFRDQSGDETLNGVQDKMLEFLSKHGTQSSKFPISKESPKKELCGCKEYFEDVKQLEFSFSTISSFKTDGDESGNVIDDHSKRTKIICQNTQNTKFNSRDNSNVNVSPRAERAVNETSAPSDIEGLLEMSEEDDFPDDEILRGLRARRMKCIKAVRDLSRRLQA